MYYEQITTALLEKIHLADDPAIQSNPELNFQFIQNICAVAGFYRTFWKTNFFPTITELLHTQQHPDDKIIVNAMKLRYQNRPEFAYQVLQPYLQPDRRAGYVLYLAAELLREQGKRNAARQLCRQLLDACPHLGEAESCLAMCDVDELFNCQHDYYRLLHHAHALLKPDSYIEIGVASGKSLALTRAGTRAIGIDPTATNAEALFFRSLEVTPTLFGTTSDDFFNTRHLPDLLGRPTFCLAFIDGYHSFEQALSDFINLERWASPSSVIFIHDCLPVNPQVATRERATRFWCGDVWRIIPCLKELRPDLHITTFPAAPSGLAMITGLNPASETLARNLHTGFCRFLATTLPDSYADRRALLNVHPGDPLTGIAEQCARLDQPRWQHAV